MKSLAATISAGGAILLALALALACGRVGDFPLTNVSSADFYALTPQSVTLKVPAPSSSTADAGFVQPQAEFMFFATAGGHPAETASVYVLVNHCGTRDPVPAAEFIALAAGTGCSQLSSNMLACILGIDGTAHFSVSATGNFSGTQPVNVPISVCAGTCNLGEACSEVTILLSP